MKFEKRYLTLRERLRELAKGLKILGLMLVNRVYVTDLPSGKREKLSFREALDVAIAHFDTAFAGYVYELKT